MHHVVTLIVERKVGACTNRLLYQLLSVMCLMSKARCKTIIEPGVSDLTLTLQLVEFTDMMTRIYFNSFDFGQTKLCFFSCKLWFRKIFCLF
ncbi:hypothetical protein Hanom_Chr11g01022871 [Helianthus anomalus]